MQTPRSFRAILVGSALALTSCNIPVDAPSGIVTRQAQSTLADTGRTWLPVGTIVPVGTAIAAPPEPYNPEKHGPALRSNPGLENLANAPGYRNFPKRGRREGGRGPFISPPPGNGDRGFFLTQASRPWYGMSAMYDLNLNLQLPTPWGGHDTFVYAPTTLAPGGACIEIVQVYRRLNGGATTGKYFGLWDWCVEEEFVVLQAQVTSWTNRYVRTYQGKSMYAVSIVTPNSGSTPGQCWYGLLYDYSVGGWVQLLESCGETLNIWQTTGWTMWESWWLTNGACPNLPSIRSLDIMLYDPQSSTPVPFTNWPADYSQLGPNGSCWPTGTYTFASPVPGLAANSWRGNTPNP